MCITVESVRATVSMARIKTDEIVALDSIPSGAVHGADELCVLLQGGRNAFFAESHLQHFHYQDHGKGAKIPAFWRNLCALQSVARYGKRSPADVFISAVTEPHFFFAGHVDITRCGTVFPGARGTMWVSA